MNYESDFNFSKCDINAPVICSFAVQYRSAKWFVLWSERVANFTTASPVRTPFRQSKVEKNIGNAGEYSLTSVYNLVGAIIKGILRFNGTCAIFCSTFVPGAWKCYENASNHASSFRTWPKANATNCEYMCFYVLWVFVQLICRCIVFSSNYNGRTFFSVSNLSSYCFHITKHKMNRKWHQIECKFIFSSTMFQKISDYDNILNFSNVYKILLKI